MRTSRRCARAVGGSRGRPDRDAPRTGLQHPQRRRVNIAIRFFLGYFLIVGMAAWFVLNFAVREVEPGVRQAAEDTMVDMANLLAEQAAFDVSSGQIATGRFATAVKQALDREPRATIYGVDKEAEILRVYMTDAHGAS